MPSLVTEDAAHFQVNCGSALDTFLLHPLSGMVARADAVRLQKPPALHHLDADAAVRISTASAFAELVG